MRKSLMLIGCLILLSAPARAAAANQDGETRDNVTAELPADIWGVRDGASDLRNGGDANSTTTDMAGLPADFPENPYASRHAMPNKTVYASSDNNRGYGTPIIISN